MKRKQRRSLPWRRFGRVILLIIKSGEILLWISLRIMNALRSYVKHLKKHFIRYPNALKLVKKNSASPQLFSTHCSVFGYLTKHSLMCLMYVWYITGTSKLQLPSSKEWSKTLQLIHELKSSPSVWAAWILYNRATVLLKSHNTWI